MEPAQVLFEYLIRLLYPSLWPRRLEHPSRMQSRKRPQRPAAGWEAVTFANASAPGGIVVVTMAATPAKVFFRLVIACLPPFLSPVIDQIWRDSSPKAEDAVVKRHGSAVASLK